MYATASFAILGHEALCTPWPALLLRTACRTDDPIAAWFINGGNDAPGTPSTNGNGRAPPALPAASGAEGMAAEAASSKPPSLWDLDFSPPTPMDGKMPQWGSKIRVSAAGESG